MEIYSYVNKTQLISRHPCKCVKQTCFCYYFNISVTFPLLKQSGEVYWKNKLGVKSKGRWLGVFLELGYKQIVVGR